ncbi:indole-3-glycerol-phosphate synthase [Candidatus Desulfovibrio trichonymphae]|uniref:indole-3-glycerol-phosphate synthase n=1 Tax=Candidatus Desulfovibrio trichonymphae TaxID=1725232 RepID=A0A1J1DQE4_9BACT|nr:indole-3-glycerol-phosphate synthase [Candidatus Desulfovibrio trichonymphae]BAV92034.1 indole-3-glycerol phosphate synthase [Candidatus Desulfovibrio trichonymphae]GHU98455.1 indole-3-glycerol phosphate synthase [Deltaproteobacteria bacterium]
MRLERFYKAKLAEVESLRRAAEQGFLPEICSEPRPDFSDALRRPQHGRPLAIVAEYKRASPSHGVICEKISVEEAARQYAAAGAAALSVLTEEMYFHGNMNFLKRAATVQNDLVKPLPLLRKDFIFDLLQVRATAATPASAVLIIVKLTPDVRFLRQLREEAEKFGMQAVVEVFDKEDLRRARESGARIIQVNARNLDTLQVDRISCCQLAEENTPMDNELWIAASGISRAEHLVQAAEAGYNAVLIGSALMRQGRPGVALRAILQIDFPARRNNHAD